MKLLLVFVPGKVNVASEPPTNAVLDANKEKLPDVTHFSVYVPSTVKVTCEQNKEYF